MSWHRWDDETHLNPKMLAVSIEARWLHFAAVGECRRLARKGDLLAPYGILRKQTAVALAKTQGIEPRVIKELLQANYENPLWHSGEDDTYSIHDYEEAKPPPSIDSKERVRAFRERTRRGAQETPEVTVTHPVAEGGEGGLTGGSTTSAIQDVPEKRSPSVDVPQEEKMSVEVRASRVGSWWATRSGEYPAVKTCRRIARFDVPLGLLLEHLESVAVAQVAAGDQVRTLDWFTNPEGISRLQKLQSESHARRTGPGRRGGVNKLGELLDEAV